LYIFTSPGLASCRLRPVSSNVRLLNRTPPVIHDLNTLQEVRTAWEFVRHSRNVTVGNCKSATWTVGFNQAGIRDLCFNLLLASALSVLEDTLRALRKQGEFSCKDSRFGPLMKHSQQALPWVNWMLIDTARDERNKSVHERVHLPHARCRDYIAAIETELLAWRVLQTATPELWHW
jgi:hypothetical protein